MPCIICLLTNITLPYDCKLLKLHLKLVYEIKKKKNKTKKNKTKKEKERKHVFNNNNNNLSCHV